MLVCPSCLQHGEGPIQQQPTAAPPVFRARRKQRKKDVFTKMEKELISDYPEVIKKAREQKGLTREKLGFRIGERTVTLSKIENGDLRPTDQLIKKLEKELDLNLMEEVKQVPTTHHQTSGYTLGDFVKTE